MIIDCERITRDIISSIYPELCLKCKTIITQTKQDYFVNNIDLTKLNMSVANFLFDNTNEICVLWTSAEETRVNALLKHYELDHMFDEVLYSNKRKVKEDIVKICDTYGCNFKDIIIFEDNYNIIQDLQKLGLTVMVG